MIYCPFCNIGKLTPRTRTGDFGDVMVEGLEGYVCDNCPSQPIFPDQIRRNQERIKAARPLSPLAQKAIDYMEAWISDGPVVSPADIQAAIDDLTASDAAGEAGNHE